MKNIQLLFMHYLIISYNIFLYFKLLRNYPINVVSGVVFGGTIAIYVGKIHHNMGICEKIQWKESQSKNFLEFDRTSNLPSR